MGHRCVRICLTLALVCSLQDIVETQAQTTARPFRDRSATRGGAGRASARQQPGSENVSKAAAADSSTSAEAPSDIEEVTAKGNNAGDRRPGQWALESLHLKSGSVYQGLVQAKGDSQYDFAEIVQPPGAPMHAVLRGIPIESVAKIVRLPREEHQQLAERFAKFRNRAAIEAGRVDQVDLVLETRDGVTYRVYRGDWFELWSTTDDEPTRRCVVRLEQMFRAYRTVLPPRTEPAGVLQVYVYGSLGEYQNRLRQLGLSIENAAFYAPRQRMIVAGSEVTSFARRLQQHRSRAAEAQREYARLDREFTKGLGMLSAELKSKGFTPEEIAVELGQRKANWKSEMKAALDAVNTAQRQNEAKFSEVTAQMFARLYHEAFHAYLDHFVFPHEKHHVPRWLNEGLAQVFESGQLDGDFLRIDAPSRERLQALRLDMEQQPRLSLAQLLTTADAPFMVPHESQSVADDERMYLYAWGLAWYLAFERDVLASRRLQRYLGKDAPQVDPVRRFEELVGEPLGDFEKDWRASLTRR